MTRPRVSPSRSRTRWAGRPAAVAAASSPPSARCAGRPVRSVTRAQTSSTTRSARPSEPPATSGRSTRMRAAGTPSRSASAPRTRKGDSAEVRTTSRWSSSSQVKTTGTSSEAGRREGERPLALDDRLGRSQRLVHVAFGHGGAGRDARVVLRGSLRVERGRQRLELELDELQRAARELGLLGRRDREAVTDEMDDLGKRLRRVRARQHLDDPRQRARGGRGGADHARVRARRAAQREMQRPGLRVVAGERGLAGGAAHAHGRSGATWAITAATGPA